MAINKLVMAALKALSYPDIDIKRNYKWERQVENVAHYHYLKPFFTKRGITRFSCRGSRGPGAHLFPAGEDAPCDPALFPRRRLGLGEHRFL